MTQSTFPSAPLRTGRAAFTASGSLVSGWVVSGARRGAEGHHVIGNMSPRVVGPFTCALLDGRGLYEPSIHPRTLLTPSHRR